MDSSDPLIKNIQRAHRNTVVAGEKLDDAVHAARLAGATWLQVGQAMGISKQAASQRFHRAEQVYNENSLEQISKELNQITDSLFAALAHAEFERFHSLMTYVAARLLSKRKVTKVWQQVLDATGSFIEVAGTRIERRGSGFVLTYRLSHERGDPVGQIAFNSRKQVTGLVIFDDDSAELPW